MRRVWVDGWQMQCCGEPFAVGSSVEWSVVPIDQQTLGAVLGESEAARITDAEERHLGDDAGLPRLAGTVRSIAAVFCAYGPADEGPVLFPVPGTSEIVAKQEVDGWETESDDRRFVGYVVDLDEDGRSSKTG